MSASVLIVEDEEDLARLLADYLERSGFETACLADGDDVLPWIRGKIPDLILLGLTLPNRDGFSICREIRYFSAVPIIMVSALTEEIDCLLGLELGADDYVCKPFSPREVVARVKSVLRRAGVFAPVSTGLMLDEQRHLTVLDGRELDLTTVEFKLLQLLSSSPGRIYTRSQLMGRIYPDKREVCDRTIDSHIKNLRKKIASVAPDAELIHSLYGVGYKFESA
jgi:two-component system, OmpR family, response regulator BaeR